MVKDYQLPALVVALLLKIHSINYTALILIVILDEFVHVYSKIEDDILFTRQGPRFRRSRIQRTIPSESMWCSILKVRNDEIRCLCADHKTDTFLQPSSPSTFKSHLIEYGQPWLWTHMHSSNFDLIISQ